MNSGLLKTSNIISVIAMIILPFVFLLGSFQNLFEFAGNSLLGLGFLLLYFLLTTVGYWGHMIQGIRSIGNGKKKTLISAAVFQLIMLVMYVLVAMILSYRLRKSSFTIGRNFYKVFLFLFLALGILAVIRIHLARQLPDESMASTASKNAAKKVFMFCVAIPGGFIAFALISAKFLNDHPAVLKVVTIIASILVGIFFLIGALLLVTVLSAPFVVLGGTDALNTSSSPSKRPAMPSVGYDANAQKKQKLLKQREYFVKAWKACEDSNWDTLTCVNRGVTSKESGRKHFKNEIDRIDAKLRELK